MLEGCSKKSKWIMQLYIVEYTSKIEFISDLCVIQDNSKKKYHFTFQFTSRRLLFTLCMDWNGHCVPFHFFKTFKSKHCNILTIFFLKYRSKTKMLTSEDVIIFVVFYRKNMYGWILSHKNQRRNRNIFFRTLLMHKIDIFQMMIFSRQIFSEYVQISYSNLWWIWISSNKKFLLYLFIFMFVYSIAGYDWCIELFLFQNANLSIFFYYIVNSNSKYHSSVLTLKCWKQKYISVHIELSKRQSLEWNWKIK